MDENKFDEIIDLANNTKTDLKTLISQCLVIIEVATDALIKIALEQRAVLK